MKTFELILAFVALILASAFFSGCEISDDGENTFSVWLDGGEGSNYYLREYPSGAYLSKGYLDKNCHVYKNGDVDGCVAKFKISASLLKIELFEDQSLNTLNWYGTDKKILVYNGSKYSDEKTKEVGYVIIENHDGKYKLIYTEYK